MSRARVPAAPAVALIAACVEGDQAAAATYHRWLRQTPERFLAGVRVDGRGQFGSLVGTCRGCGAVLHRSAARDVVAAPPEPWRRWVRVLDELADVAALTGETAREVALHVDSATYHGLRALLSRHVLDDEPVIGRRTTSGVYRGITVYVSTGGEA